MPAGTPVTAPPPPLSRSPVRAPNVACDVFFLPSPHRSARRMRGSLAYRHRRASGILNSLERVAPRPRHRCHEAHDLSRQPISLKSHTLHFSANFLIARSTVSLTVEVGIPRTSAISR